MEKSQNITKWIPTDKRFVAFFDILGFKDLVMRSTHNEIYEKLSEISKTKNWLESLSNANEKQSKLGNGEVYTVSFSDSIVVFSKNDDIDNFKFFLVAIRWLFAKSIEKRIPMKGGIAHGEISLNKSEQIYFGQAIIDAYLIEEDVNYLGVTAHNSIDKYIDERIDHIEPSFIEDILFDCKTPFKCGLIEHKNVDWFKKLSVRIDISDENAKTKEIEKIIKSFRLSSSGSPRKYIDNTLEILNIRRP